MRGGGGMIRDNRNANEVTHPSKDYFVGKDNQVGQEAIPGLQVMLA